MERRNSAFALHAGWMGKAVAFALVAACHHAPGNPLVTVPSAGFAGRAFGDTVTMRTRIVALDTVRNMVMFTVSAPSHIVLLDVSPGISIEPLYPDLRSRSLLKKPGEHRIAAMDSTLTSDDVLLIEAAYARCVAQATRVSESRRRTSRPQLKRDSAGRVIPSSVDRQNEFDMTEMKSGAAAEASCRRSARLARPRAKFGRQGEHYLVVLASHSSLSGAEVALRIKGLAVVGSDVATTIEAIGAGLFLGSPGSWSGYYVNR